LKTSTYFWFLGALILLGCNITKKVPEGQTLYHKHNFEIIYPDGHTGPRISRSELEEVARIRPNTKIIGIFLPLRVYNSINEDMVKAERRCKNAELHRRNVEKKIPKAERKNASRIAKAQARGDSLYLPYRVKLKDTLAPRKFFYEWLLYEFGESPNLMNENLVHRSTDQIRLFLQKKGYYHSTVSDTIIYTQKRNQKRKAEVGYTINLGLPHTIDSIYFEGGNARIHNLIRNHLARNEQLKKGDPFDRDVLDGLRFELARMLRNETFYEFSPNHIFYKADTTAQPYGVQLGIAIRPRSLRDPNNKDSIQVVAHRNYKVGEVYYHIVDTVRYEGNYSKDLSARGLTFNPNEHAPTLDTFLYEPEGIIHADRRRATFLYNGSMPIKPELLEMRNYLEHNHWYRAYYLDRTYNQMLELDIFQSIQPVLIDNPAAGTVDVHYYLIPANTQKFSFEPRATNSNGFLGMSASVSYRHRNLFKSGGKFVTSMSVGLESQPPILDASTDGRRETFYEIGPTAKLTLPGLLPISALRFSKRQTTSTEFSAGLNYQNRQEFARQLLQFNYLWKWRSDKLQTFQMGLPIVSGFKFVRITQQSPEFLERINDLNDLFLKNAYSNQLIFNDFKLIYTYSNERLLESVGTPKRTYINYDMTFDLVGNSLALFTRRQDTTGTEGIKTVFGVPFSQFVRIDNELKIYQRYSKGRVLAMRFQAGMGYTYGNSNLALPFDYAFFAGGSNDNRGWRAREMSPGAYQYHRDVNRTLTQFGDIRLGASFEYRFNLLNTQRFKGAVFSDMGNLWTLRADPNREGGQFTSDFYKQIAISGGFGLRIDATFLVIRLDLGIPILNPAMSPGARWIWNSRELFEQELDAAFAQFPERKSEVPRPFMPRPHFAIGFPF
jgi:outer membrane protein insertion porin family